jgi:hypothetical protein
MSIRRRLAALEQHAKPAESRTSPDRLSPEELAVIVDLAGSDATPPADLSPLTLEVLHKARHFSAFLDQMAARQRSSK